LSDEMLAAGKIGTLIGSALSAVLGLGLLSYCLRGRDADRTIPAELH